MESSITRKGAIPIKDPDAVTPLLIAPRVTVSGE